MKTKTTLNNLKKYTKEGELCKDTFVLPEPYFGVPWNADLVHQVVMALQSDGRHPYAHVKTRGEVSGGGKKPWRQKGTGRARHGSTRSPIWVGGGVAHGPRNDKNYSRKVNKKAKNAAIKAILSQKIRDNEIIFVENFDFDKPKTADIKNMISALAKVDKNFNGLTKKYNAALVTTPVKQDNVYLSTRNVSNLETQTIADINPLVLMKYKYIIMISPEESMALIVDRLKNTK